MPITTELQWTGKTSVTFVDIENLTNELLKASFDIDNKITNLSSLGWKFKWSDRKTHFGNACYRKKEIWMSKLLCELNLNNPQQIENTIRHEIAHALTNVLTGERGHGFQWVRIARLIKCSGKRCYDTAVVVQPPSKYRGDCSNCGYTHKFYRLPSRKLACTPCCNTHNNGKYSDKYVLTIIKN